MGRQKLPDARQRKNVLRVCLTEAERAELEDSARQAGKATSVWVREQILALIRRRQERRSAKG